jgi:hypothetical protein
MTDKPIDNGGPAFPTDVSDYHAGELESVTLPTCSPGMTLRDWFAGMALHGELANARNMTNLLDDEDISALSCTCYKMADAMLLESRKGKS